ncbi:uncharacterized protein ANIA_11375 [Aspergillus nidulans FGSC A4]|uniref:Uncharacterized protein n=1 Tax=Emericella nidulans (strain FGSC A4 / ATCC 38163 / CBS 112.46 / NRRL 194 / M139) TaxID=227321 RepID=C8VIH4_EMENI|nr:hypothetical protein [Aspergillus nidulans FGSC A4]CBF83323.1 TPA: hypothetical protein ANIA_11375 [Aspergillus nidulans FGSC A4]
MLGPLILNVFEKCMYRDLKILDLISLGSKEASNGFSQGAGAVSTPKLPYPTQKFQNKCSLLDSIADRARAVASQRTPRLQWYKDIKSDMV